MTSTVLELPPRKARRYMNDLIISAVVWCFFGAVAGGPVFSGLLDALDLSDPQIGFVMSIGLLSLPLQLIGAIIQQKYFRRKHFWGWLVFLHYTTYLALALVTALWTKLSATAAATIFMVIVTVGQGAASLANSTSNAWMGEVVPVRESTGFWNRRSGFVLVANMVAGILAGVCVDMLGKENRMTYAIMLCPAAVFGYTSMIWYLTLPDRDTRGDWQGSPFIQIVAVLRNRPFRQITWFFTFQQFAVCCCSGFYFIYLLKDMHLSMTAVQILSIAGALVGLLAAFFFRIVGQRYGNKPVLAVCTAMKAVEFTLCALWMPGVGFLDRGGNALLARLAALTGLPIPTMEAGFFTVLPAFLVAGFFNIGLTASQMALITSIGPRQQRSTSIGIYYTLVGLTGFAVTSSSGLVYQALGELEWVQRSPFSPFNILALCSAVGFALSLLILRRFREDGSAAAGTVVRIMLSGNPIRTVYQAHALAQPIGELSRVRKLRRLHTDLISNELVQGLYSPSSRVRDGALLNVSTMEGEVPPEIVDELIRLVDIPALGMQAMAARTLGRLRMARALPALTAHFRDPDLAISQACIFAAGLIGDPTAEAPLRSVLADRRCQACWPHAAEALSRLGTGDFRFTREIFRILDGEAYWVLRQQTLISLSRLMMRDKNQAYVVFEAESRLPGSEIERLLKALTAHPVWPWPPEKRRSVFDDWIGCYDRGEIVSCMERVLLEVLPLYGIAPDGTTATAAEFLSLQFAAGGMRDRRLELATYAANNLWLQLKLWAELKYETDGTDRFLLLTQLIAALELLAVRVRDNGDLNAQTVPDGEA